MGLVARFVARLKVRRKATANANADVSGSSRATPRVLSETETAADPVRDENHVKVEDSEEGFTPRVLAEIQSSANNHLRESFQKVFTQEASRQGVAVRDLIEGYHVSSV